MPPRSTFLLLFCAACLSAHSQPIPSFPRPVGIYAIGQSSTAGIRALPFVDGFVMRIDWADVEPLKGAYDFSSIDAVVRRLDTLGQGLTLDVFRMAVPDYVLAEPGALTHTLELSRKSFETAVPWDPYALSRFEAMYEALSEHRVFSLAARAALPLRAHPVLQQIDASPIGMNGIRDLNHSLTTHPTYTRQRFIRAVVHSAEITRRCFPSAFAFVAVFGMQDSVPAPPLTNVIRDSLMRGINRGQARPMLGFFQENLSCNGPMANTANILHALRDSTFTMYQMLQGWRMPFLDPAKTDTCKTDSTGPDVAMWKAVAVTNCLYFELYTSDLDWAAYAPMFTRVRDSLWALRPKQTSVAVPGARAARPSVSLLQCYPNPLAGRGAIRFTIAAASPGGSAPLPVTLRIHDALGRELATLVDASLEEGSYEVPIEARSVGTARAAGVYLCRLTCVGMSKVLPILILDK